MSYKVLGVDSVSPFFFLITDRKKLGLRTANFIKRGSHTSRERNRGILPIFGRVPRKGILSFPQQLRFLYSWEEDKLSFFLTIVCLELLQGLDNTDKYRQVDFFSHRSSPLVGDQIVP